MAAEKKYLYGPVPSRRLGRSLGIDIMPVKICTLDCIYCQVGKTTNKTIERAEYTPIEPIIAELKEAISNNLQADYITIAGSGEPTLNSNLGKIIDEIKKITNIPVAIVTNGTLLYRDDVRDDCKKADIVLPSLDAGDDETFDKINRPHMDISIEKLISGLSQFRKDYSGQIWLEVFLLESINTDDKQIAKINAVIQEICPDKVQLNTAVRPTIEKNIHKLSEKKLQEIASKIGNNCEVIADFSKSKIADNELSGYSKIDGNIIKTLFSMLKRRPCSLEDICSSMKLHPNEAIKYITELQDKKMISIENINGNIFYKSS